MENTRILFEAAREAGVRKIVHISVTRASIDSNLTLLSGQGAPGTASQRAGYPLQHRPPTLVYGREDILVNNIAWLVRKFPAFPIFGSGAYRLQPVFVGDLAHIAADQKLAAENGTIDAIGPDSYSFEAFVRLIASRLKPGIRLVHLPAGAGHRGG